MKFNYCSSKDELMWYVNMSDPSVGMTNEKLEGKRKEIQQWVETTCSDSVFVWNKVETPTYGEKGWGQKMMPQGDAEFYFLSAEDALLFRLKWI